VRIVAATNVNLMQLVKSGKFREDLFYRLNIIAIDLPPLRERENDVDLLTDFFLAKYSAELQRTVRISAKARQAFHRYAWPGNVRELQNLLHRMVIFAESEIIDVPDLPETFRFSAFRTKGANRTLAEIEREHIIQSLSVNKHNISRTAEMLGIDRKTLREKIKRYKIAGGQE
jgi:two-component system response regulator HydG